MSLWISESAEDPGTFDGSGSSPVESTKPFGWSRRDLPLSRLGWYPCQARPRETHMRHGWRSLRPFLFAVCVLLLVCGLPLWGPLLGSLWRAAPPPNSCSRAPRVTKYNLTVSSLVASAGTIYA